jgi:hypothetical protein
MLIIGGIPLSRRGGGPLEIYFKERFFFLKTALGSFPKLLHAQYG